MAPAPEPPAPTQRAILLLLLPTLAHLQSPTHLLPALADISRHPLSHLLIILLSPLFAPPSQGGLNVRQHWEALQRLLGTVYVEATREGLMRGEWEREVVVLLEPDLEGVERVGGEWDIVYTCEGLEIPPRSQLGKIPRQLIPAPVLPPSLPSPTPPAASTPAQHSITALGGTFDHLHSGHRILLSSALLLTSQKLIVGLTAAPLLQNKKHAELVQSFSVRTEAVEGFCSMFRPGVRVQAVELSDVAGPTAWDKSIEALVVSRETVSGAEAIAKIRASASLPPLEVYVIDVISADDPSLPHEDPEKLKNAKISSTAIRGWLAEKRARALREPAA
ncbi:Nucleotidylyl transferase [Calocera viscosa TUFC12733]|uniref:Nucleotidylyl transferase n=1 Tax=Calocera viscosa (strain TUFC12733) TaxID=1330018 RepID=A0A167NJD2_CALVF|nr:Nucleotidylyl transferase [Calocera viscosa TUFC12733]